MSNNGDRDNALPGRKQGAMLLLGKHQETIEGYGNEVIVVVH